MMRSSKQLKILGKPRVANGASCIVSHRSTKPGPSEMKFLLGLRSESNRKMKSKDAESLTGLKLATLLFFNSFSSLSNISEMEVRKRGMNWW